MKCLTVRQPWASLLLGIAPPGPGGWPGLKDVENRSWAPVLGGKPYRGPLLIHAGQAMDRDALFTFYGVREHDGFPLGVLLGVVDLWRVSPPGTATMSPWAMSGQFHWHVRAPKVFPRFLSVRGQQGLFDVDGEAVREMVAAVSGPRVKLPPAEVEWLTERAGILEFSAGLSRDMANREAYGELMLQKHGKEQHERIEEKPYYGVSAGWWHRWESEHEALSGA